jgi:glycosyltransferase involved in cell wall biosynthesis
LKIIQNEIVIPIYGNEDSISDLVNRLNRMNLTIPGGVAVIFVFDGLIDNSYFRLMELRPKFKCENRIIRLSKNYGSFSAIRIGISESTGKNIVVMSADLQEPEELFIDFFKILSTDQADIVFGHRLVRKDGLLKDLFSSIYWKFYKKFLFKQIPTGGIDVFGISRPVANLVSSVRDKNTSLIGLLLSIGFRQEFIGYGRLSRESGSSRWTFRKRFKYLLDSVYSFTSIPLLVIQFIGAIGSIFGVIGAFFVAYFRFTNVIPVPGYASLMILIFISTSFLLFSIGVVGSYVWRIYENSKGVPFAIIDEIKLVREED